MSEILPNKLYLGSFDNALDEQWLQTKNIQTIITIMAGPIEYVDAIASLANKKNIQHHIFAIDDFETTNIMNDDVLFAIFEIMQSNETPTLVHCLMGVSRSATVVLAYLMATQHLYLDDATKIVLKSRNFIHPNDGFIKQLIAFEKQTMGQMTYLPNKEGIQKYKQLLHSCP